MGWSLSHLVTTTTNTHPLFPLFPFHPSHYRGRGAFESLGAGLAMSPGDVAFKCNLACLEREGGADTAFPPPDPTAHPTPTVTSRRAGRDFQTDGPPLCEALNGVKLKEFPDVSISVRYATEHRAGVVLSRPGGLSDAITGTDPLRDGLPLRACEATDSGCASAVATAAVVNAASAAFRRILATHPVNAARVARGVPPADALLLRGAGMAIDVPPLTTTAGWPRTAAVAPTKIIAGLAATLGMDVLEVKGATGDYGTSLRAKVDAAAVFVETADAENTPAFLLLHIKAVDDAGHDKDAPLKVRWLRVVDRVAAALVARLQSARLTHRTLLAVTGDHSTPVDYGDHSSEPVPFAAAPVDAVAGVLGEGRLAEARGDGLAPPSVGDGSSLLTAPRVPGAPAFDEVAAAGGCLGRFPGGQVVPLLVSLAEVWGA